MVRVAGLSKAVRMDLEEVLVRAEDQYHIMHSDYTAGNKTYQHGGTSWKRGHRGHWTYNELP